MISDNNLLSRFVNASLTFSENPTQGPIMDRQQINRLINRLINQAFSSILEREIDVQAERSTRDQLRMATPSHLWIDEATEIPEGFLTPGYVELVHTPDPAFIGPIHQTPFDQSYHAGLQVRFIPPATPSRHNGPEGYFVVGGTNTAPITEHTRGLVFIRVGHGPGCKEWIRGYRDNTELNRFLWLVGRSENTPAKLEERRKRADQRSL